MFDTMRIYQLAFYSGFVPAVSKGKKGKNRLVILNLGRKENLPGK